MHKRLAARNLDISSFHVMELLRRAKQLEAQGIDVIHMEIGEPDFPTLRQLSMQALSILRRGCKIYTGCRLT